MHPETILQINIVETLSLLAAQNHFTFFAVPNEAFSLGTANKNTNYGKNHFTQKDHARMMMLKKMGMLPGVSDLVLISKNDVLFLEIKTPKGTQSENQKIFENRIDKTCGYYYVVRAVDDVIEVLRSHGII